MNPEQVAKNFAISKVGGSVSQAYWRSQLEEAWLDGWNQYKESVGKKFSDKNRRIKDTIDPTTGERVELKTKKQINEELSFELDL